MTTVSKLVSEKVSILPAEISLLQNVNSSIIAKKYHHSWVLKLVKIGDLGRCLERIFLVLLIPLSGEILPTQPQPEQFKADIARVS